MSSPDDPDPEQIARLQKQLADAAAQVADVQSQLEAATGKPAHESSEQARNEWAEQLREALSPIDFGATSGAQARPADLAPLADPPRPVPFTFRIAIFAWSWWEGFAIFLGVVAPIALWAFVPQLIPSALISAIAVIGYIRGHKAARRLGLLKRGKVATVTNADELNRGTYYSGVTYSNMRVTQAHGWDVTRQWYSGPASKTKIGYTVDGVAGSFMFRGIQYEGGVILARSDRPVALCVNQFVYDVKPGPDGQLVGGLRAATWIGIVFTLLMESALVAGAILAVDQIWL